MDDLTILVADDHDLLRVLMRKLLSGRPGWTVVEASDGQQALQISREQPLGLAILDQRMPEFSGTEVARTLRAEGFTGPIVLFTAYLEQAVEDDAGRLGLVTLAKSDINQLADVVEAALASE